VYIEFKTRKLDKCFLERKEREKAWGKPIARKYVEAVNLLKVVKHPSDLRQFRSFNYHPLTGDRKEEHAMDLGKRERLIFTVREDNKALIARVEEVSTTHYVH
jgi:proteic killer suppression protein